MRFFLAHPKTDDEQGVDRLVAQVRMALTALGGGDSASFDVVPGRDDFTRHFKACGSWDSWIERWAKGTDEYGTPYYHGIICTHGVCARATGEGVKLALATRKPVYLFHPSTDARAGSIGSFSVVNGIERLNREYREDGKAERFGHYRLSVVLDRSQATV
jgi:hypothetical protein